MSAVKIFLKEHPKMNFFKDFNAISNSLLLVKASEWQYEGEYRTFIPFSEEGLLSFVIKKGVKWKSLKFCKVWLST